MVYHSVRSRERLSPQIRVDIIEGAIVHYFTCSRQKMLELTETPPFLKNTALRIGSRSRDIFEIRTDKQMMPVLKIGPLLISWPVRA